jgi:DNA-binding MarR family transcriptional regulator
MVNNPETLTIIDLISEQHAALRKITEDRWTEECDIAFSHTDFFLLSKIAQGDFSISRAANFLKVSRQAMQQNAVRLEERGYIQFERRPGNHRDKYMVLTELGLEYHKRYDELKKRLETEIEVNLGKDTLAFLKSTLSRPLL